MGRIVVTKQDMESLARIYLVDHMLAPRLARSQALLTRFTYDPDPTNPSYVPKPITNEHYVFETEEDFIISLQVTAYNIDHR